MAPSERRLLLLLLALALVAGPGAAWLWRHAGADSASPPRHSWDSVVAVMDERPEALYAFLAERASGDSNWDYRRLPGPARNLWATLRCEMGRIGPDPDSPDLDEAAAAYAAIGLEEIAKRIAALQLTGERNRGLLAILVAGRERIVAARRAYALANRLELENP